MELKKLSPSFTHQDRNVVVNNKGPYNMYYTGFIDKEGDLRRVLIRAEKADTLWIDDHYYSHNKALYYTHTKVLLGDTLKSCTYFFHREKCIKKACAFGSGKEEKEAENAMKYAFKDVQKFLN